MNEIKKIFEDSNIEASKKVSIISKLRLLENLKKLWISEGFIVDQINSELAEVLN